MEDFNQKEIVNETVQAGQSECHTETAQLSKADSLEGPDAGKDKLTVEEFHRLLEENTQAMNEEREKHVVQLNEIKRDCDEQKDIATQQDNELQIARDAFNATVTAKNQEFNAKASRIRDFRRKTTENYLLGVANEKSRHAKENERISSERHNIFERWRNSGGRMADVSSLFHPGWDRTNNEEKGDVSDGE